MSNHHVPGYTAGPAQPKLSKSAKKRQNKQKRKNQETALKDLQESDGNVVKEQIVTSGDDATYKNISVESKITTNKTDGGKVLVSISSGQQGVDNSKAIQADGVLPVSSGDVNNKNTVILNKETTKDQQLEKVETALQEVGLGQTETATSGTDFKDKTDAEPSVQQGNALSEDHYGPSKRQRPEQSARHYGNEPRKSRWDQPFVHGQPHPHYQPHATQYEYRTPQQQQQPQHIDPQYSRQTYEQPNWSQFELSKELVRIVRHGSYRWIKLDDEGYASVDLILHDKKFCQKFPGATLDCIKQVVYSNDKKRFELVEYKGFWYIKATQGHTVKVENLALDPVTDASKFPEVVHGTSLTAWQTIKKEGLKRMTRTHIHFAIGMPGDEDVLSGMRNTSDVVIRLNLAKALEDGLKFFISSNRVILSEGDNKGRIHPKFFDFVMKYYPRQKLNFEVPPDYDDKEDEKQKREKKGHGRDKRDQRSSGNDAQSSRAGDQRKTDRQGNNKPYTRDRRQ
uniref:2'-phosphotransferase n=1 Tax=Phallusia mammillata TaxID=59560 RepID=A0A6F9D5A5_9ASCI|nr:protein argonaute-2 [Phallusia mammillata]